MNYSEILEQLNSASLFDLYRLNIAIDQELERPERLKAVMRHCRVGDRVSWFNDRENRIQDAVVIKHKLKSLLVRNLEDGMLWSITPAAVNLERVDTDIAPRSTGVDRNSLKVGDSVCFMSKKGNELYGKVIRLNQKSASVEVNGCRWRVSYRLLTVVIDGETAASGVLIHER